MRRALLALFSAGLAFLPSAVSAQSGGDVTLTINPTQGPVGTAINFTVTGCPAVADGPDGRVFLLYGNFSGGPQVNPTANFEGSPASGALTVTAPPAGFSNNDIDVIADCFANPGAEAGDSEKTFTMTGSAATTTTTTSTTATTSGGSRSTTTTTPSADGGARPAAPQRVTPNFTG